MTRVLFSSIAALLAVAACSRCTQPQLVDTDSSQIKGVLPNKYPDFNADTAYNFIVKQLEFGYRVPGMASHKKCAEWLQAELRKYCDTVYFQQGNAITWDKKRIPIYNIIGSFKPSAKQRAMLASHWDSRPWADNGTTETDKPILAANDGASGVAVLLELARQMKSMPPSYGVDIVFFDAEDYGKSEHENSFCLGSQYWGKKNHVPHYRAQFGVLLDMVGGKNAQFPKEGFSIENAGWVVSHFWSVAAELGFGSTFITGSGTQIIDDHKYVFEATQIPMIDVIQYNDSRGFAPYWHTQNDNLESIDKGTLNMVGKTVSAFVFNPPINIIQ